MMIEAKGGMKWTNDVVIEGGIEEIAGTDVMIEGGVEEIAEIDVMIEEEIVETGEIGGAPPAMKVDHIEVAGTDHGVQRARTMTMDIDPGGGGVNNPQKEPVWQK